MSRSRAARKFPHILLLIILLASAAPAQRCVRIRGRAVWYRGDGFFAIWHVGTHHVFFPRDKQSADLICQYFDCESGDSTASLIC